LSDDATQFDVAVPLEFVHPDSGFKGATELQTGIALAPSTDSTRAEIVTSVNDNCP
jgi:hypothetical protein